MRIKFLGHSAFELSIMAGGVEKKVIIDPYISANKMCPVKVDDIQKLDIILVTHGAHDHLGDTVELAKRTEALLVCDPAIRAHAVREGIPLSKIRAMVWGMYFETDGIMIRAVRSDHLSFFESKGTFFSGMPLGFIITTESDIRLYHTGDTSIFSDLKLIGKLYKPNIMLIPVGAAPGALPELSPDEAVLALKWLHPEVAILMHYQPGEKNVDLFLQYARRAAPWAKVIKMEPGEIFEYEKRKK